MRPTIDADPLGFDPFDDHVEPDMLVTLERDRAACAPARRKRLAFQVRAEPGAEFLGIRQRVPDALARRVDQRAAFDAVGVLIDCRFLLREMLCQLGNQEIHVRVAVPMCVGRQIHGHAGDRGREVGTVIEVETA